jgi:hypothetical protein
VASAIRFAGTFEKVSPMRLVTLTLDIGHLTSVRNDKLKIVDIAMTPKDEKGVNSFG